MTETLTMEKTAAVNDTHSLSTSKYQSFTMPTYSMHGIRHLAKLLVWDINKDSKDSIIPLKKLLRSGNKKIPSSTAIFNMASAHNCPSKKLGLCKAELALKNNLNYVQDKDLYLK